MHYVMHPLTIYLTPHMQELNIQSAPTVTDTLTDSLCSILEYYDEVLRSQTEQNPLHTMMGEVVKDACRKVLIPILLYNHRNLATTLHLHILCVIPFFSISSITLHPLLKSAQT